MHVRKLRLNLIKLFMSLFCVFCIFLTIFFFRLFCRLFGPKRCARCMASISSSELVMRARHLVFHVRCFSCTVCNSPLTKGDQFGMRDSSIFCRSHYEIAMESPTTTSTPLPLGMTCQYSQYGSSPNGHTSPSSSENAAMKMGSSSGYFGPATPHSMTGGLPQTPRQKGRPRKRKPKDIEAMKTSLGEFGFFFTYLFFSHINSVSNIPLNRSNKSDRNHM